MPTASQRKSDDSIVSIRAAAGERPDLDPTLLVETVESVTGVSQRDFCGPGKSARVGSAKQILFLAGRRFGASVTQLAKLTGMTISNVSRRTDAAAKRSATDEEFQKMVDNVCDNYRRTSWGKYENRQNSRPDPYVICWHGYRTC